MPEKKETTPTTEKKPDVKVQDLAPKKDAKGGVGKKASANAPRATPEGYRMGGG